MLFITVMAFSLGACGNQRDSDDGRGQDRQMSDERDADATPKPTEEPAPTEAPLLTEIFASAKAGNELQFGTYEQDNNLSNGAEPIEWVVLANDGEKIFVVSKYVLDKRSLDPDNKMKTFSEDKSAVTWEVCQARQWLNNDFYNTAFSEEEKKCILESEVKTPDTEDTWRGRYDQKFKTYGGKDTKDFIFLLSYEETEKYLKPLKILGAEPTAASGIKPNEETGYGRWALRSAGTPINWEDDYSKTSIGYSKGFRACGVDGYVAAKVNFLNSDEKYWSVITTVGSDGMRPAMWIRIKQ